jgi:outer membrane protein assembly factor BamB
MSEEEQANNPAETSTKSRFPKKALIWTIFVGVLVAVLHWQTDYLNETFNMNPAIPWIALLLLGFLTLVFWFLWAFFFAKLRLVGLLILAVPTAFFTLYYPNFLGDANFAGFKPRFWTHTSDYVDTKVDAATTGLDFTPTSFDFPQFLGANRDGVVAGVKLAENWTSAAPVELWKHDVGEGWAGIAVVNGHAITQEQRGKDECVTCYDIESGELNWIYSVERRHEDIMAMGKAGPRATPTIHEGKVYCTSGIGVLDCLDGSTGELIWSVDVPELVGIEQGQNKNSMGLDYTMENSTLAWGRSHSPLVVDDAVVVGAGGPLASKENGTTKPPVTLIAFDKNTGEEKWRGGSRMIAYGSPSIETVGGKRQILLVAEDTVVGHDAETGQELWSHERSGSSRGEANCSQVTRVDDSRLIVSKGYNMGGEMIKVESDGDRWNVTSLIKDPRILKTKLTSPIVYQGHTYSLSDGYLECAEIGAETITRKWKQRGRFGNGQILLVGDKLLVHSERGSISDSRSTLFLVEANPSEYKELGKIRTVKGICWNTFCLYKDLVVVRSDLEMACFRLPLVEQSAAGN